jgi:hypothetical protein
MPVSGAESAKLVGEHSFEAARAGGEVVVQGVQNGLTTTRMQMATSASTGNASASAGDQTFK